MTQTEITRLVNEIRDTGYEPTDSEKSFLFLLMISVVNGVQLSNQQELYLKEILKKAEEDRDNTNMYGDFFPTGYEIEDIE